MVEPESPTSTPTPIAAPLADARSWDLRVTFATDRGARRSQNEDSIGFDGWTATGGGPAPFTAVVPAGPGAVRIVVADGMGGHQGGATASRTAAEILTAPDGGSVATRLLSADLALRTQGEATSWLTGMGTTVAGIVFGPTASASAFNIGDSRVYRLDDGLLVQLTVDDRLGGPGSSVLSQCLGGGRERLLEPHEFDVIVGAGDRFLICSDGLHDVVDDEHIEALLLGTRADTATSALIAAAYEGGAPDNVTIIIVDVLDPTGKEPNGHA